LGKISFPGYTAGLGSRCCPIPPGKSYFWRARARSLAQPFNDKSESKFVKR
jgi:hypothetical protein